MENVRAVAPNQRTIVTGERAVRTASFEGHTTNAAVVIIGYPFPNSNTGPA